MARPDLRIRESGGVLEVALHVQPRAKRSEIVGLYSGALKLKVSAPPVDDAANRAIIDFFATLLGIPRSHLKIASGHKSRQKIIQIEGMTAVDFLDRIALD